MPVVTGPKRDRGRRGCGEGLTTVSDGFAMIYEPDETLGLGGTWAVSPTRGKRNGEVMQEALKGGDKREKLRRLGGWKLIGRIKVG